MVTYILIAFVIILLIGLLPVLGFWLLYLLPKKIGYPKLGRYLSIIFVLLVLSFGIKLIFEDFFFIKSDAEKLLGEQGIILSDKFEIEKNNSAWGIGDFDHTFILKISSHDQEKIIGQIKQAANFIDSGKKVESLLYGAEYQQGPIATQNYETKNSFVREYLKPAQNGYAPVFRRISIDKGENKLIFEEIDK